MPDETPTFQAIEVTSSRSEFRLARHQHHVANVVINPIPQAQYPIPLKYQTLIQSVPAWLSSHLRILEGDMFLEMVVEEDLRTETFERVEVIPQLEVIPQCEPGILMGHYVLAGWAEREITEERERLSLPKRDTENAKRARHSVFVGLAAATLAVLAVVLLFMSRANPAKFLPPSFLAALIGIGLTYLSLKLHVRARSNSTDAWFAINGTVCYAAAVLAFLTLGYAVLYTHGAMLLAGVLMVLASGVAGAFVMKRQTT